MGNRSFSNRFGFRKATSASTIVRQARALAAKAMEDGEPDEAPPRPQLNLAPFAVGAALIAIAGAGVGAALLMSPQRSATAAAPPAPVVVHAEQSAARAPATAPAPASPPRIVTAAASSAQPRPAPAAPARIAVAAPPPAPRLLGANDGNAAPSREIQLNVWGDPLRVRVLSRAEAQSLSDGRWQSGLEVLSATPGNHLDVRNGDLIYGLCDRGGAQSARQILAGLGGQATCVSFVRGSAG